MYILITYDINVTTKEGQGRLRKVAKVCMDYGQRVQNSVFECKVNQAEFLIIKNKLKKIINKNTDSLRFYKIGGNYDKKVEHIGAKCSYNIDDALII